MNIIENIMLNIYLIDFIKSLYSSSFNSHVLNGQQLSKLKILFAVVKTPISYLSALSFISSNTHYGNQLF